MANTAQVKILKAAENLIAEGSTFIPGLHDSQLRGNYTFSYEQQFTKWLIGCRVLMQLLGEHGRFFAPSFERDDPTRWCAEMLGTLEALRDAVRDDLLITAENLLRAEVFADLLEQAEHLLDGGYFLAAGVLGRAVLEDHLRNWCSRASCQPAKGKPTLDDFKTELYRAKRISTADMQHVQAMAAVGNEAAHNLPTLTGANVKRLLSDMRTFLGEHPIP
ncbi:MAG TPA: hypothetical protein VFE47_18380 [Tepidisphaeraceae bacterium]|nr:hypothetical protein [Tepidisphaeraceae bacterium]